MACCFVNVVLGFIRPIPVSRLGFGGDTVLTTVVRLTVRGRALAVRCVARLAFGLTVLVVRRGRLVVVFRALRPVELDRVDFALDFRPLDLDLDVERPRERLDERPPELRPRLERPRRAILSPQYLKQNNYADNRAAD
jgi:hypothetical protein